LAGAIPQLSWRFFRDSFRLFVGLGAVRGHEHRWLRGFGLKYHVASSFKGLITHELAYSNWAVAKTPYSFSLPKRSNSMFGLGYRANIELGPVALGLEAAPALAFDDGDASLGYVLGMNLEYVLTAAGGGPF
jgi:hypothetical protein